jgi:PLP dependent protein
MKPSPTRITHLLSTISTINSRITHTTTTHSIQKPIRLVAVSKLKPLTDIIALASPSPSSNPEQHLHYHFGENYVQELLEKSRLLPNELQGKIRWHFIGGLQSNKAQLLAREVRGLWAVESVDSVKKANLLDRGREERLADARKGGEGGEKKGEEGQLRVFVQVNTSGEDSKSGVEPKSHDLLELCRHVQEKCENLKLLGLMTIGAIARSKATTAETENEDFQCLRDTRNWVAKELGIREEELELSMGMSEDFEAAIRMGSDEVRVGSTIFGERPPKAEAKVLPDKEGNM